MNWVISLTVLSLIFWAVYREHKANQKLLNEKNKEKNGIGKIC